MFPLKNRQLIRGAEGHLQAGLGIAADYVADGDELIAPFSGRVELYSGVQGGNWLALERENGDILRFAHLEGYKVSNLTNVRAGQAIAITGNTGSITTGPHLHIECYINGQRVDPEKYFMIRFKVSIIGQTSGVESAVQYADAKLQQFSGGQLGLELIRENDFALQAQPGRVLTDDETKSAIIKSGFGGQEQCIIVSYLQDLQRPWYSTQYMAGMPNIPIIKAPYLISGDTLLFEIGHALIQYYNENRDKATMPSISNVDNYSGGEQIVIDKVNSLMPYISVFDRTEVVENKPMTKQEVEILYEVLEIGDPDGSGRAYWEGKPLTNFLKEYAKNKGQKLLDLSK